MFTVNIDLILSNGVANIGGKDIISKGIVTVSWSWTDDKGKLHTHKWNNVLYFIDSPLNILSETAMSESMKDDEGTWVRTKRNILFLLGIFGSTK